MKERVCVLRKDSSEQAVFIANTRVPGIGKRLSEERRRGTAQGMRDNREPVKKVFQGECAPVFKDAGMWGRKRGWELTSDFARGGHWWPEKSCLDRGWRWKSGWRSWESTGNEEMQKVWRQHLSKCSAVNSSLYWGNVWSRVWNQEVACLFVYVKMEDTKGC